MQSTSQICHAIWAIFYVIDCYPIGNANIIFVENTICFATNFDCFAVTLWCILWCTFKHGFCCVDFDFVTFLICRAQNFLIDQNLFCHARKFVVVLAICFSATYIHKNNSIFLYSVYSIGFCLQIYAFLCKICIKE